LLYGSETWTIKARNARRITAVEMKYMRRTAGYAWIDYKTNTQIAKELKITNNNFGQITGIQEQMDTTCK
jgi:DNA-binding sugar fermentation-stimulating protein